MTRQRALRLAREWSQGHVCSLRDGEAAEYHSMFAAMLEEAPPHEPLMLEELSLCNDPVWIKRIADENLSDDGWAIVEGPRCLTWHNGIPVSWEIRVWWPGSEVEDYPEYEDYGKTWFAYRRPPEGEV